MTRWAEYEQGLIVATQEPAVKMVLERFVAGLTL